MSISIPPPDYQFNGLFYNPNFWINATDGLTQADANQLYLRKTTTDSASALETFNGGIKTASIDVTSGVGASLATMFSSQTAGANLFGNLGSSNTLRLGNQTTPQSVHVSNVDCNGSQINNSVNNNTGTLSVGNLQTSGILNIGTSTTRTGDINIATGVGNTASIKLGSSTTTVQTNTPLTLNYLQSAITGTTQLGYKLASTGTNVTTAAATPLVVKTVTLTDGAWLLVANCGMGTSGTKAELSISSGSGLDTSCLQSTTSTGIFLSVSRIISGAGTYNMVVQTQLATTVVNVTLTTIRIA
jgi:hypothetical protein